MKIAQFPRQIYYSLGTGHLRESYQHYCFDIWMAVFWYFRYSLRMASNALVHFRHESGYYKILDIFQPYERVLEKPGIHTHDLAHLRSKFQLNC